MKKICTKCGEPKNLKKFSRNKDSKDGHWGQCKTCEARKQKAYRADNKEKLARKKKAYFIDNKEELVRKQKVHCANLTDRYVSRRIVAQYNIARQDITPEMIEAKRQMILTHRLIKETRDEFSGARN